MSINWDSQCQVNYRKNKAYINTAFSAENLSAFANLEMILTNYINRDGSHADCQVLEKVRAKMVIT